MSGVFTWTYDAETGVYKNHALSGALMKVSARKFKFVQFTQLVKDFARRMGESITLIHYKPLTQPTTAMLTGDIRVPIDQLTMGKTSITIHEWGRGVEYESLAEDLSKFSPKEGAQKGLIDQMNEAMDNAAAVEFTGTDVKVCFIPTSLTGGTWDTDGTPSTPATVNITKHHIAAIRDYMVTNLHVPFFSGEHFAGLFATKALRGLRDDKVIEAWNMYLRKGDHIWNGEIGQLESVRAVEITNENALSNSVGTGNCLGEGVIFGDESVARIEIENPHLRAMPNYSGDFGRRKAVIWYGVVAYGVKWPTATDREAKIVKIVSQ